MTQLKAAHHLQRNGLRQLYLASVNVHGNVIYTVAPHTFCATGQSTVSGPVLKVVQHRGTVVALTTAADKGRGAAI